MHVFITDPNAHIIWIDNVNARLKALREIEAGFNLSHRPRFLFFQFTSVSYGKTFRLSLVIVEYFVVMQARNSESVT